MVITNWTPMKPQKNQQKKESDSINIWKHTYGTNMQQSVWQRSFKPNYHGNSAKGGGAWGGGGHGRSVER